MVKPIPSFLTIALARNDFARLGATLYDLQRQTASGNLAADLKGYGQEAGRIVSARTAVAQSDARVAAANRLSARLDVQDTVLGRVADAASQLKQNIYDALASDNPTYLADQIKLVFSQATDALNTTYEGAPLFSGERRGGPPVQATSVDDLAAALSQDTLFNESTRTQTVDVGAGGAITVADKASDIVGPLYNTLRDLYAFANGIGSPMTAEQRATLTSYVDDIDTAHQTVVNAQGRNGDRQATLARAVTRLTNTADLLNKHLSKAAEADLAEVSMRLAAAKTQYEATASIFQQIKDLSLVNFLD